MNAITKMDGIRPALDELVPSRYALRVGEIDVLVISDGVVTPPESSAVEVPLASSNFSAFSEQ